MQRLFDIALSMLALVALSPLLIPIVVILSFTGEGEVFFRQERVGLGGKMFGVFKFATMLKNSPDMASGTVTLKDDPRVLPFGRFLRRTKVNELPQLLNILIGDMSLVGPRPQTRRCFEAFPLDARNEIIKVRPGLSGVGSIIFRGEEELLHSSNDPDYIYDQLIMPYKGLVECWYVENQGLLMYLKCLLMTLWVVVAPASTIAWRVFHGVPRPPNELVGPLRYIDV